MVPDETFGPLVRISAGGIAAACSATSAPAAAGLPLRRRPRPAGAADLAPAGRRPRHPRVDLEALEALALAVAQLAQDVPQIERLHLNPVFARPDGLSCVDVKVLLQPAEAPDAGVPRRLRPLS